ncbi:Ankyrin repeat domain-containing protein [Plasmodiophora brassicae]
MRIVDPVRMGRPAVYCGLVAILLVSGAAHALTLRSSDGVDVEVDSSAAVAHSGLLRKHLVGPDTQDGIAVPTALNVASPELQHLVRFMHDTAPTDIGHAGEWVTSQMSWMDADTVGRVLADSLYLEMRAFLVAVVSLDVDWYRVAAYRPDVNSALVLVTNAARLCRFARTAGQKAIVDQIRDALAVDATRASSVINNAMWADGLRLMHWVACHGDRNLMAFLLRLPGVDVNVRDIHQQTPLHWAVRADRQDMVALLLSTPNIDVNAESGRATALHVALSSMRYCTANLAWTYDAGTREDRRRRSKIMSILARHGPAAVS